MLRGGGVLTTLLARAEAGVIGRISGVPEEHLRRTVRIYKPTRCAMQQGAKNTASWRMEWMGADKWANPLMGWTSTSNPLSQTRLAFDSLDEALAFATKNGRKADVEEPQVAEVKDKSNGDNFKFAPVRDADDV
eukprot:EC684389.1.p2 GENE.EC684389.1~~EC684389.1.p2  ORF type:complete len:134 (+),score=45.99 EC684389.1:3-404(+)